MKTKIPPIDLQAEYREIKSELTARTQRILASGRFILGAEVQEFERSFARFIGTKYAVGVASGSDALLLALMALGIKTGDEVLTTPFSFISTATVIARLGAKPVFIDIEPETFNLNPALIKKKITKRTRAIIPVHLYGNPCLMDEILAQVKRFGLFVIEDCAQSCGAAFRPDRSEDSSVLSAVGGKGGAAFKRKQTGSFGDFGAFSFYPTKTLGAAGDAGAVTTNDKKLYEKIKSLHLHGEDGAFHSYRHPLIGINSRLDEIQAAALNTKLKHLAKWNQARRKAAKRYDRLISESGLLRRANRSVPDDQAAVRRSTDWRRPEDLLAMTSLRAKRSNLRTGGKAQLIKLELPVETEGGKSVYHQYVIRTPQRDRLLVHLRGLGISAGVYYPVPLHLQPCFAYLGYGRGDFPEAERASHEVLSLPLYPQITMAKQQVVVSALK